jgi:signal transduction histidine kinase
MVVGDRERLTQVAHNLVRNSLAHTPPGTSVTVATSVVGDMGQISVTDRGPGIPPEEVSRVFDRFYRGDRSRSSGGTGLGLAIVKAIAEALGGSAAIVVPPEGGVKLVVTVPRADASEPLPRFPVGAPRVG